MDAGDDLVVDLDRHAVVSALPKAEGGFELDFVLEGALGYFVAGVFDDVARALEVARAADANRNCDLRHVVSCPYRHPS